MWFWCDGKFGGMRGKWTQPAKEDHWSGTGHFTRNRFVFVSPGEHRRPTLCQWAGFAVDVFFFSADAINVLNNPYFSLTTEICESLLATLLVQWRHLIIQCREQRQRRCGPVACLVGGVKPHVHVTTYFFSAVDFSSSNHWFTSSIYIFVTARVQLGRAEFEVL